MDIMIQSLLCQLSLHYLWRYHLWNAALVFQLFGQGHEAYATHTWRGLTRGRTWAPLLNVTHDCKKRLLLLGRRCI